MTIMNLSNCLDEFPSQPTVYIGYCKNFDLNICTIILKLPNCIIEFPSQLTVYFSGCC